MPNPIQKALKTIYQPEQILTDLVDLLAYSYDNSRQICQPDLVVLPNQVAQISATIRACIKYHTPLTTRGRGSATTGAALPSTGGLVLSTELLNRIIKIDPDNRYAQVQAGVTNHELQTAAKAHGLFWGPKPTSSEFSSIGGNIACNASGARSVKYGSVRDNILGIKFIDGRGQFINAGKPVSKLSVGYDLAKILTGSEGTLGVMIEATLPLLPLPEATKTVQLVFAHTADAAKAVVNLMKTNNIPSALEFLDNNACKLIQDDIAILQSHSNATMLLINIDGNADQIDADIDQIDKITKTNRLAMITAQTKNEAAAIWQARKILSPKLKEIAPKKINEDVVVPIAQIPALLTRIESLQKEHQIHIVNFGHAGDGNIHVNLLINPDNPKEAKAAKICLSAIFQAVIDFGGAISGEHGIGLSKREFLSLEFDRPTQTLMAALKSAFDPHHILNPDKGFSPLLDD